MVESFGLAAGRSKEAGFDGIQIHAGHGYLVSEFMSPAYNKRTDEYGGNLENRARFLLEAVRSMRERVGRDYPVLIKMNAQDNMKGGLKLSEGVRLAQMMAEIGFDGIEVSCGIFEDGFSMVRGDMPIDLFLQEWPMYRKMNPLYKFVMKRFADRIIKPLPLTEAYNREAAREIKGKVNVPVFLVGGISQPSVMEEIIEKGEADYISLCRPLIADSKFPERIRHGSREPSLCIYCNYCGGYMVNETLRCYRGKELNRTGA